MSVMREPGVVVHEGFFVKSESETCDQEQRLPLNNTFAQRKTGRSTETEQGCRVSSALYMRDMLRSHL